MFGVNDMAQAFSKSFYNSKEWKAVRKSILMRDSFLCRYCKKPAEEVHHIIHLTPENIGNPKITMGADNLISLCGNCHKSIHAREQAEHCELLEEITFDSNGMPVKIFS